MTGYDWHDAAVDLQELGERVKAARIDQRWTVQAAAKKAGIARDTWKRVENGHSVHDTSRATVLDFLGLDDRGRTVAAPVGDLASEDQLDHILDMASELRQMADNVEAAINSYRTSGREPAGVRERRDQDQVDQTSQDPGGMEPA